MSVCECVCVCACVRACVRVCVCGRHGNTSLACLVVWQMAAPPDSNRVVETRWGQGALALALQANSEGTPCIHIIHAEEGAVLALGPGLWIQVTAIVIGSPALSGVLSPGLNSKLLIGYSASLGWVVRHLPWRVEVA